VIKYNYILTPLDSKTLERTANIIDSEKVLIESYTVNSLFDTATNICSVKVYSLNDDLVETVKDYTNFQVEGGGASAGSIGVSQISINPIADVQELGYENGDVKLVYNFSNDTLSDSKAIYTLFVEEISQDRTELRGLTTIDSDEGFSNKVNAFIEKFNSSQYLNEVYLKYGDEEIKVLNIGFEKVDKGSSIIVKLYKPLPSTVSQNTLFNIEETISDSIGYEVSAELLPEVFKPSNLKGPNFNVEIADENSNPTEFFNYNELFSYPVTGSNYELLALFNETSAQIDVDHNDYSDFIHFSSAEERLRNFKYKLDLIKSYESTISSIKSSGYVPNNASGSSQYYEGLVSGVVKNFDHYDRFLYFQSGSNSWPKENSSKPYENYISSNAATENWYLNQLTVAENFDNTNSDNLTNTVPLFLREDSNNAQYMLFLNMIGQHFDNLWIYFKATSDKYDADNRLDYGISKDLVREAIESFGVKLYNSNSSTGNLFSMLVGETPSTGSALILDTLTILSGSANENLQPVAKDNYQKEIYKRIYHNLPLLLKSKGTDRGIRALINCFGIPSDLLEIRQTGGAKIDKNKYLGPYTHTTSSLDKVRLDLTGSILTGSTLSRYTSIVNEKDKYSDDIHTVEIGLNYKDIAENFINLHITSSFDIDDYIGDPRQNSDTAYHKLNKIALAITHDTPVWEDIQILWQNWDSYWAGEDFFADPRVFVHTLKYFDNSIFRIIKDFIPARSNINTGLIIQPHSLNRSKAKQVEVSWEEKQYTSSIDVGLITASNAGAFVEGTTTNYTQTIVTPLGKAPYNEIKESPKLTGEFSGSRLRVTGKDLNRVNVFKKTAQPIIKFDLTVFNLSEPIPASCNIEFIATYLSDTFTIQATGTADGFIELTYPTTVAQTSGSIAYEHNYDIYEFFTIVGTSAYYPGGTFDGWYDAPTGGNLITDTSTLNIYFETQNTYGSEYYARFS
jgi:hypothetical protein